MLVHDRQASASGAPAQVHRLLVVEDDAGVAGGIVRGLRAAGFEVELATNGVDGAKKGLEGGFSAIVLDYTNYKLRKKNRPPVQEKISYETINQGS